MRKKNMRRRGTLLLLTALLFLLAGSISAQAATKNYMKKQKGITWDLKKGKTVSVHVFYMGIGKATEKLTLTSLKTKKTAGKKNYKTITARFVFDDRWNISEAQVDRILRAQYEKGTSIFAAADYVFAVDYHTGMRLGKKNKLKVKVKDSGWKHYSKKTYYGPPTWRDENGRKVRPYLTLNKSITTVTVTCPKDYDGLCFIAGACTRLQENMTKGDKNFVAGKAPFGKATILYSKSDKLFSHGIRVK